MSFATHSLSPSEHAALLAAEREGGPFLVHRDAHGDLRIVPLATADRIRIGRTAGNDVVLAGDVEASRAHAVLEAAILATRTAFLPADEIREELRRLLPLVEKTGGPAERRAFAFLAAFVERAISADTREH